MWRAWSALGKVGYHAIFHHEMEVQVRGKKCGGYRQGREHAGLVKGNPPGSNHNVACREQNGTSHIQNCVHRGQIVAGHGFSRNSAATASLSRGRSSMGLPSSSTVRPSK